MEEHTKTKIEQAKVIVEERKKKSLSQVEILEAISGIIGQQRQEVAYRPTRQLFDEIRGQYPRSFKKQVNLTAHLYKLKIVIFLSIEERIEL